jgi:hypothetical protein
MTPTGKAFKGAFMEVLIARTTGTFLMTPILYIMRLVKHLGYYVHLSKTDVKELIHLKFV